jgi:hypothetical protein
VSRICSTRAGSPFLAQWGFLALVALYLICSSLAMKGSLFLLSLLVVSEAILTVETVITQENRASWQRWIYICLPTLDCSSHSICEHVPAQKRTFHKTCHGYVHSHHGPDSDFVSLYPTRIWLVKFLYSICHIITVILLLRSEFHVRPVLMFLLNFATGLHITSRCSVIDRFIVVQRF